MDLFINVCKRAEQQKIWDFSLRANSEFLALLGFNHDRSLELNIILWVFTTTYCDVTILSWSHEQKDA